MIVSMTTLIMYFGSIIDINDNWPEREPAHPPLLTVQQCHGGRGGGRTRRVFPRVIMEFPKSPERDTIVPGCQQPTPLTFMRGHCVLRLGQVRLRQVTQRVCRGQSLL
ncbi:hypothetical protein E2C01_019734 [Portunus trituberculatus]|uniref:Uncharacterized protein n=1 Tax=Portunus trituberculatus TaxID=210409 RepID=A0A5B7DY23_PORTR|nr:hypothetical protein [Portunus trituberculatus]